MKLGHEDLRALKTGMSTPVTLPCYLPISQSKRIVYWLITYPGVPLLPCLWKCFAETLQEFRGFEHEPPFLFVLAPCNKHCTFFHHNQMSLNCFYWSQVDMLPDSSLFCSLHSRPVNARDKVLRQGVQLYLESQLTKKMADSCLKITIFCGPDCQVVL